MHSLAISIKKLAGILSGGELVLAVLGKVDLLALDDVVSSHVLFLNVAEVWLNAFRVITQTAEEVVPQAASLK